MCNSLCLVFRLVNQFIMWQVWDVSKQPAQLVYNVQTIASVGRIKWRPQRRYHIANCSLLLDHSINVWDVRRPFIPFANFDEHKDVATCECTFHFFNSFVFNHSEESRNDKELFGYPSCCCCKMWWFWSIKLTSS